MRPDNWHVMAALKEIVSILEKLRKDIDELRDEVKVMEGGGGIRFVLAGESNEESEEEGEESDAESSSVASAQSAPAAIA